ncbi:MAG: DUF2480 family protein [bacterium]|nr:DUF2480 family protein [bacterium]
MSLIRFPLEEIAGVGIVREREVRRRLDELDWQPYCNQAVLILWLHDRELPLWGYLMASARLSQVAAVVSFGEACSPTVLIQRQRVNME